MKISDIKSISWYKHNQEEYNFMNQVYFNQNSVNQMKQYLRKIISQLSSYKANDRAYLIDKKALSLKINLKCDSCKNVMGCCGGTPYPFEYHDFKQMKTYEKDILKVHKKYNKQNYKRIKDKLFDDSTNNFNSYIDKATKEEACMGLYKVNGVNRCVLKTIALDKQIPFVDICNLSCLLFPMEIFNLHMNDGSVIYFITSIMESKFINSMSRWGVYDDVKLDCVNCKNGQPLYIEMYGLITDLFDSITYIRMKTVIERSEYL